MNKYKSCTDYWLDKENLSLRGEFEKMYQDIADPWGCDKHSNSINNKLFCEIIFHNRKFSNILDIGSGLGNLTKNLYEYNKGGDVVGWEISNTAVSKAMNKYPFIKFENKNIMTDNIEYKYELITISEVMWYLLEKIDEVFDKLSNSLSDNGILAIHQYFPKNQNFGNDVINGLEDFESFIEERTDFKFLNKIISFDKNDRVLLALLSKKDN